MRLTFEEVQEISDDLSKIVMTADGALAKLTDYLHDVGEAVQFYPSSTVARSEVLRNKAEEAEGYRASDPCDA